MGSIPKIVSTPVKWVSKKILHKTLLRFPGGDPHDPIACTYCPEMCRFSCPTAVVSNNDTVTPCNKMGYLYKEEKWPNQARQGAELWPIYDCTGCGRCTEYCVYQMPVADTLFEARKKFGWEKAKEALKEITPEEDPVGDLADELGSESVAQERLKSFVKQSTGGSEKIESQSVPTKVMEPKSLSFLRKQGHPGSLSWESDLLNPISSSIKNALSKRIWLLHESVWMNRHLDQGQKVMDWVKKARAEGIQIRLSFHQGRDCIECGGEGAYSRLFPEQAKQMAVEFWERDQHRAEGVLTVSARCASHFKKSLGEGVPVFSIAELVSKSE